MSKIYESDVENFVITLLEKQGYTYLSPEDQEEERQDLSDVVLRERLKKAIDLLNPNIPEEARDQALREVLNLPSQNLIENNESFHKMLTDGVGVEYQKNGETIGRLPWHGRRPLGCRRGRCRRLTNGGDSAVRTSPVDRRGCRPPSTCRRRPVLHLPVEHYG